MFLKPKMLFLVFVVMICCTNLCNANDEDITENVEFSDDGTGRALSLAAANHPAGNLMISQYKISYSKKQ